jgi:glycine dehydrogenase
MRWLKLLENRDLSLTHRMIPLGSCTMKLNPAAAMLPMLWPAWSNVHPFVPRQQARGYHILFQQLEQWLAEVTGFAGVSLQPNAGSQGEYAGLLAIQGYHSSRGQGHRNMCLIPQSAHGTNPASAVMAGMKVIPVGCYDNGDIDLDDLRHKASEHAENLAALMITWPSTHGVFEDTIAEVSEIIHSHGGQVYLDGANMNAQVGFCRPGDLGADVCHLNLHKTFAIPHGGGGPGVGPIGVARHLVPFLPGHPVVNIADERRTGAVSAAPWGSALICTISWMYIRMMGGDGLKAATAAAIVNANYMAHRLKDTFPILYTGHDGLVAHECIIDLRPYKAAAGVTEEDIAKRLIDYGFHAPTVSWPVPGTMMIEPTESEDRSELDRFCDAMIAIKAEVDAVAAGTVPVDLFKNAPHPAVEACADAWPHAYAREKACYPMAVQVADKFWPGVARINNAYGDRNLVCACSGFDAVEEET